MSMIKIANLTFGYDNSPDNIFENISFQLDTTWKLGFTGRNGRGKTTFLNLLMGRYAYDGKITSDVKFEYFPYHVANNDLITMDVLGGICVEAEDWQIMREISLLQLPEDRLYRPFGTLSAGERTKALLAALFLVSNSFLLIDEPTNHLDMDGRKLLGNYLKKKQGFILVSHDRSLLDNCVDHILSLNKVDIEIQKGNFSSWQHNKSLKDVYELAENAKLKKEIKRLDAAALRTANWADKAEQGKSNKNDPGRKLDKGYIGHKAAKMMQRSQAVDKRRQNAVTEKKVLLKNLETSDSLKLMPLRYHNDILIDFKNAALFYDGVAACKNVTFTVRRGERVALKGKNGSGKSSVLKLVCGAGLAYEGEIVIGGNLKISYISQDTSHLTGTLFDYAYRHNIDESLFKTILRKLNFERIQFEKDLADFSGGQKKKVLLAKSLCEQAHLYVWDEPLNYIDVLSRIQIENLLLQYKPTLLFVEHDEVFCDKIAERTIFLS